MSIEVTVKLGNGAIADETIIIDADFIKNNESIMYEVLEAWGDMHNECQCTLNESQSYCECDGKYGDQWEIHEVKDMEDKNESSI